MNHIFYRRILLFLLILSLLLPSAPAQAAPLPQQPSDTLRECSDVSEESLQDELNTVTQQVFADALTQIDTAAIVEEQWTTLKVDATLDAAVDTAVEQVKNDGDFWGNFLSGWSADKAKEMASAVANSAFASQSFRKKLDELSFAVAGEIGNKVGELSAQSVSAAFYCLQTFIGGNYAQVLVDSFAEQVQTSVGGDVLTNQDLDPGVLAILDQHKVALGGLGVIIAAQITRRLLFELGETIAKRVAGRIVGRVLGRVGTELVPIAGWIIGTGMIAYDLYANRDGALPEIQETMKSADVKAGIRSEVVASIEPELAVELPNIARSVANTLFTEWREVKRDIRQVIDLSVANPAFKALLEEVKGTDQLARLVGMVGAILSTKGQPALEAAISDGTLRQAINLPASAAKLVESTQSLPDALAWGAVAGDQLDKVVAYEIYKYKAPNDLDAALLQQLLALDDKIAISNLAVLDTSVLRQLMTLSSEHLKGVAVSMTPDQLSWLAQTLSTVNQQQKGQIVAKLVSNPTLVAQLQETNLLSQISDVNDLDTVLAFVAGPKDLPAMSGDVVRVATGAVGLRLFAGKYGWTQTAFAAVVALLIGLFLLRLIYSFWLWLIRPLTGWRR